MLVLFYVGNPLCFRMASPMRFATVCGGKNQRTMRENLDDLGFTALEQGQKTMISADAKLPEPLYHSWPTLTDAKNVRATIILNLARLAGRPNS